MTLNNLCCRTEQSNLVDAPCGLSFPLEGPALAVAVGSGAGQCLQ